MKEYSVSLIVSTHLSVTTDLLAGILGISRNYISKRINHNEVSWTITSDLGSKAPLEDHIASLLNIFDQDKPIHISDTLTKIYFIVGVFYDTSNCTVSISGRYLNLILSKFPQIELEIVYYPCDDSEN